MSQANQENQTNKQSSVTLYPSEWSIMEALWAASPQTIVSVWHAVEDETHWSKSTVNTLLGRMVDKGLIRFEEGSRAKQYYPNVERGEVALAETQSLLQRVYQGSVSMLMTTLVDQRQLSQEEIDELYAILEEAKRDD